VENEEGQVEKNNWRERERRREIRWRNGEGRLNCKWRVWELRIRKGEEGGKVGRVRIRVRESGK
jgi:hypothetical protein